MDQGGVFSREARRLAHDVSGASNALLPLIWQLAEGDAARAVALVADLFRRLGHSLAMAEVLPTTDEWTREVWETYGDKAAHFAREAVAKDAIEGVIVLGVTGVVVGALVDRAIKAAEARTR